MQIWDQISNHPVVNLMILETQEHREVTTLHLIISCYTLSQQAHDSWSVREKVYQ